jgi:hypothetical protein
MGALFNKSKGNKKQIPQSSVSAQIKKSINTKPAAQPQHL